jgi:hypothetical protein
MDDDDDKKIISLKDHRQSLTERIEAKKKSGKDIPDLLYCTECENVLFYLVKVEEDDGEFICVSCQHCGEALGLVELFDNEDEDD